MPGIFGDSIQCHNGDLNRFVLKDVANTLIRDLQWELQRDPAQVLKLLAAMAGGAQGVPAGFPSADSLLGGSVSAQHGSHGRPRRAFSPFEALPDLSRNVPIGASADQSSDAPRPYQSLDTPTEVPPVQSLDAPALTDQSLDGGNSGKGGLLGDIGDEVGSLFEGGDSGDGALLGDIGGEVGSLFDGDNSGDGGIFGDIVDGIGSLFA